MTSDARTRSMDTIRHLFEKLNAGGIAMVLDAVEEYFDPDFEWRGGPAGRDMVGGDTVYRGYQGVRDFYAEVDRYIESFHFGELALEAFDDEVLVARAPLRMRTRGSHVEFEQEMTYVYRLRGGRILRGEAFRSRSEADMAARQLIEEGARA